MKKAAILGTAMLAISATSLGEEKKFSLKLAQNLEMYGGFTAGFFYSTNLDSGKNAGDKFQITNAIIGLNGEVGKDMKVGFDLAVGGSLWATVFDGGQGDFSYIDISSGTVKEGVGILWGYASFKPASIVSIDAGVLTTNIGYEVASTYDNPNITFGAVWFGQPFIYPGARLTVSPTDNISVYAEYNNEYNTDNFALGALGELMGMSFGLTYYDYSSTKNLIDIVLGYSVGSIDLGFNLDYQWLDDSAKAPGQDDTAYGVALYVIPNFGNISLPIRLEYFNEGTSGIYLGGADNGYTFTVTPTFKPSSNTYVRGEVAYVSTDNPVFKGGTKDSKTTVAIEVGFTF